MRKFVLNLGPALGVTAVALVIAGGVAFACTSLATITPSTPAGDAGTSVTVTGKAFDPTAGNVNLLWGSSQGPSLAQVKPQADGTITSSVTIPKAATAGYYVIIATQLDKDGQPVFGTPARASFQVGTPTGSALSHGGVTAPALPANAAPGLQESTAPSSAITALPLVGLGVVGAVLFIAGLAFFLMEVRRRESPAVAS